MKKSSYLILSICFSLLSIAGCSPSLGYKAGLYTKTVAGKVTVEKADSEKQQFVLVLDYHRTLLGTAEEHLNRVTAFIAYPDKNGEYSVPFAADSVKLELTFYAHNSQMMVQHFQRSLGIGSYQFNVILKEDKDWRNSYYLTIKPTLIEYITEKRYLMNQNDRYFIGEWLSAADERL